ncbi:MAG: hypothetical protein ABS882_12810, partial [Lysinibacillus sp.]
MDERTRILKLVESGVITAEEAISLLEKLSQEKAPQQSGSAPGVVEAEQFTEVTPVTKVPKQDSSAGEQFDSAETFGKNEQQKEEKRSTGFE